MHKNSFHIHAKFHSSSSWQIENKWNTLNMSNKKYRTERVNKGGITSEDSVETFLEVEL